MPQSIRGGATLIRRHKILTRSLLLLAFAAMPLVAARTVTAAVSAPTMPADQALKLLLEGNQRFVAGKLEHPNQTAERRTEVAKGQHPFASVLGHRRCGAVIAAVEGHEGTADQDVGPMLRELRPAVAASKGMAGDPVENAVRENVELVMKNLATSAELAAMVKSGTLKIVGGVYDLDTGTIEMLKE